MATDSERREATNAKSREAIERQNSPALYMGPRIWTSAEHGIECIRSRVLARIDNQIYEGWILRELDLDPTALGAWAMRLIGGPRAKPTNPAA